MVQPPSFRIYGQCLSFGAFFPALICFALSNGIPPDVVMKFTGHCDYKSMKPYIDITESAKKDAIKKLEEDFKKK